MNSLFAVARACLEAQDPEEKCRLTEAGARAWRAGQLQGIEPAEGGLPEPGRPPQLQLRHPRDLPRRSLGHPEGRQRMLHALAHIEFNAINLAWDAVLRFPAMPEAYYTDWVQVALEEARHFRLLRERLRDAGADYGQFPAHDGLWDMARRTGGDLLARLALVPRMLEARGLDVTPGIRQRFQGVGDQAMVEILNVILRDEIGHVAAGTRWFRWECARRGQEPLSTYFDLLEQLAGGEIRCPLNYDARIQAGFSAEELSGLTTRCRGAPSAS